MGAGFSVQTPLAIKRGSKRARLMQPASLLAAGGELEVRIRDLAPNGALGEAQRPPAQGSEVVLVCSGIVAPANVVWVIGRRFGLEFHDPISAEDVDLVVGRRTG